MFTILLMALFQTPQFAVLPGTNLIATEVFPELSLQTIQTAMSLPGLVAVISGVLAAVLVRYGASSKKFMTVFGLSMIAAAGVVALALHTRFWQLCLMNSLIGIGVGIFVPNAQSIMFDNFDEKTRNFILGVSFSCINGGGLVMSLVSGWLDTIVWYGGYLQFLIVIPVAVIAFVIIPKDVRIRSGPAAAGAVSGDGAISSAGDSGRTKIPLKVYYFAFIIIVFMVLFSVMSVNISTHLANGGYGDPSIAGIASALMMAGGAAVGFIFPKLSSVLRDRVFSLTFIILAAGFTLMNLFHSSLPATLIAVFLCGTTMSLLVPRCVFNVSNLSDPTNSATATMLVCCVAPGSGQFLSPVIMTNLTLALGGESTRFRFQFTALICLAIAAVLFFISMRKKQVGGEGV